MHDWMMGGLGAGATAAAHGMAWQGWEMVVPVPWGGRGARHFTVCTVCTVCTSCAWRRGMVPGSVPMRGWDGAGASVRRLFSGLGS